MKKFLSIILTVALMLTVLPFGLFTIPTSAATSGITGDCTWSLNGTVLTISGYGKMADYTYSSRAPWSNNGITKVIIRDGVTNIGDYAFYYHTYLANITIPDSVTSIGDSSFMDCGSLTSLEFPDGLTYIGEYAFCNDNITSVTIPDSVTYIGSHAFAYNDISSIVIPSKVTTIANNTFYACKSLTSVTLHDGIVSVGDNAFAFNNLSKIIIPDSVTYIGVGAFMWNEYLSAVAIGANIKTISTNAFRGCSSLRSVYYRGSQTEKSSISISSYNTDLTNATWYYNSCISTSYHTYTNDCDPECNVCSFTREAHVFTNNCDKDCNICGYIRVPSNHVYDNTCDMVCNICGEERKITHTYSDDSDESCDICGQIRGPYTITYHLDGGTNAAKNPDVYTEEDTIMLKDASKVGYDFAGWFLDADKTEPIMEIYMMGSLELYAKFLPKTYNVTFDSNGAEKSDQITITLHTGITSTNKTVLVNNGDSFFPYDYWQPEVFGYVFVGWMHNSKLISNQIEITKDIDLYAKWIENPEGYPVLGKDVTSISAHRAEEYFFISCNYTHIYYAILAQKRYAEVLSPTTHLVQYRYSASSYSSISAAGLSVSLPGYTSLKDGSWTDSGYATLEPGTLVRISNSQSGDLGYFGNLAGYSKVEITKKTTYNGIIASEKRTKSQEFDSVINAPSVSKTGYKFLGWYDSQGNQMTDTWQYTKDQTFTAKWQPQNYDIIYELDGGKNSPSNPNFYTIEDSITLKTPTKTGYTFKGWYSDANFTKKVTSIAKKTGNITLYAKWEVNSYNLALNANEGDFAPKVTFISDGVEIKSCYLYGQDTITAYRPDIKEGYIFAGWYTNSACTSLFKFNGTIANDITLYAKWVECNSNIVNIESTGKLNTTIQGKTEQLYVFVPLADGKITVTSESNNLDLCGILYDASKTALISADDISSTDLDFTYTYSVKAGQLYYIAVKGNTASTVGQANINIVWTGDCTITGTTYQNRQINVAYDTDFKLPQKPVREGYVFLGWFDENNNQITNGIWNFVTDKTLTAKWEETTYHTVVFKDLAGNILSSETYYLSEDIVAPDLPTKAPDETYIYHAKWDNNYTGVCTGDVVYSPIFDVEYIEYVVTFVDEDGTELSKATYHWGDVITVPSTPTKSANKTYTYTFAGWDKNVINCAGNTVYTATYTSTYIDYTIVFKNWDGTVISTNTYHYGDKVIIPTIPTKPSDNTYSYTFNGWDKEVSDCEGDATYTATYTSNFIDYTIVFKNWNGTVLSTNTYHYGDKVTAPTNPTKSADDTYTYTFNGWDKEVVDCVGDAIYTATYKSNYIDYTIVFKNWDGTVLSTKTYHYGDKVTIPTNPTKKADNIFTYTFAGWDKEVVDCANDTIYTATYISTYIDYTVIFKNWDDSVISRETYHYGDIISAPNNPSKPSDNTYSYIFNGWDKTVVNCVGDAIYTATYTIHADHIYDNACDAECNICGDTRTIIHDYEWIIDRTNNCGVEGVKHEECTICHVKRNENTAIPASGAHSFDNACDTTCNTCDHTRTITHSYKTTWDKNSMQHWHQCSVCGNKKDLEDHIFDNACDTTCNTCGYTRTITHDYTTVWEKDANQHWYECSTCDIKKDTADHIYNNACDTTCNVCNYVRTVEPHVYDNVCDSTCNICGFIRDNASHAYDNDCDATCNLCGTVRTPSEHVYDDNDDHYCNVCNLYTLLRYQINYWNNSVTITGFDENYSGAFAIPETISGYPVVEIDSYAFYGCSNLTSITIPKTVTTMWSMSFAECCNLKEVHISDIYSWCTIEFHEANLIGGRKLYLNGSLITDLIIPDGITEIGDYAFYGYSELKSVHIPDSVNSIGYASFRQCTKLAGIDIPNNVITIGDYAFAYCENMKTLTLGNQVSYIGECAFAGCAFTEVAFPKSVTMMGNVAFCGDTPIKIEIENIESWCNIQFNGAIVWQEQGLNLYMNGNLVTDLVIPEGVTTITNGAFAYCTNLKSVSFPNSLIAINDSSFYGCTGITSVVIPQNVSSFSVGAFKGCTSLDSLSVANNNSTYHSKGNCIIETDSKTLVLGIKTSTIPADGSVTIIGEFAFEGCNELKYIVIPDGVTTLKYYSFGRCKDLIAVEIPNSVTSIENAAFDECTSLISVTLPTGLTTLNQFVFNECYSLTNITIPKSMTYVMYASLRYCPIQNIYYSGNEEDKALMMIDSNNGSTPYATWHYNTCETHTYDNECDGTCNNCSWIRFSWSHTFTDENDLICDICSEERYVIIFKNYDGTILSENKYYYGNSVTAPTTPTRPNDDKYSYTFKSWDKTVTNCNGDAVYTATYIATSLVPNKVTSAKFTITGNNISKITAGTTVSSLLSGLNEGSYCKVYNGNSVVNGNSAVGTGMVVKIMDGNTVKASYTIIVTGDTNGDGEITVTDMIAIKAHVLEKSALSGVYATAADTNGDGSISITDFIQVKAKILEKGEITAR